MNVVRASVSQPEAEAPCPDESYFRSLIENASDIITILEPNGVIRYESPSIEGILGYRPEELVGCNVFEFIHPEDIARIQLIFQEGLRQSGAIRCGEFRFRHKDGSWRAFEAIGKNLLDDPVVCGIIINSRDITERKKAEEVLRESEERFSSAFEHAAIGMALVAPDGRWLKVNRALCESVGYTTEELLGRTFQDITHPDDLQADLGVLRQMLTGELRTHQMEKRYFHKQGHVVWVLLTVSLVRTAAGQPLYFIAQIQDITDRKRNEERLRLQSTALEAAANAVVITERDGSILWTNPAFSSLYGYSAEEVVGANCRLVKSGLQDKLFYRQLWETISTGKAWRGEIINRRKDGTLIPEEMTITPVTSERGEITHYVAINQDITERKNDENALRQAEEKYRSIFEDAVVGIFQATPEGRLLNTNRAFARMHGYDSPEEIIDKSFEKGRPLIIRPEQFEDWSRQLQQHGVMRSSEVEVQCKDGSRKWVLVNLRAVRDHDGKIVFHEGTVEDITERKLAQEQVDYLAYYDALTGLPNRMMLHERLNSALSAAARRGSRVAVLFLDLDRFKIINDSLGHSFGDLLLQQVASRLQNEIRQHDTVARVGGDEFLIVLTDILSVAEIEVICARIVKSLTGEFAIREHTLNVTCSLGVSIYPQHGNDGETLIKNADAAMYRAKDQGCNIYCFFTDEISAKVVERLNLENSLRLAIDREELFLTYQPQINIETGGIIGLEALVRWQHPERGLVMPDTFIRIAENSGLIISLGEWVLKTACRQMKEWQDCGLRVVPVAVNVSALQFRQNGFRDLIRQVLADTGLAPELLELELTESLLLSNADVMFEVLVRR